MSYREPEPRREDATAPAGKLVLAEQGDVRVFHISTLTMPELVDRLAHVLYERMHDGDDLHAYNPMQSGGTNHPVKKRYLIRPSKGRWNGLHFED